MRRVPAGLAALSATWLVVFGFGLFLSARFGKSSDQANLLLAGLDMLHGNWRLRGWSMVADPYWTSDVALGAVLSALRHLAGRAEVSPSTLVVQPALTWATLCVLAVVVAQSGLTGGGLAEGGLAKGGLAKGGLAKGGRRWSAALIVLGACFVPFVRPDGPLPLVFLSGIHLLTLAYALAAFALCQAALRGGARPWRVAALAGVALLGEAGDPLFLFVAVMPLALAIPMAPATRRRQRLWAAGAVVLGAAAGHLLIGLNAATGGFTVERLPMDFAWYGDLGTNLAVCLHGLLALFGADFTSRSLADALPDLLHLPLLLLAAAAAWATLSELWRAALQGRFGTLDLLSSCLALGAAIDVLALVVSRHIEYEAASFATARYLFPAWVFGSVLIARRLAGAWPVRALAGAALAISVMLDLSLPPQVAFPTLNASQAALADLLARQPARHGLAGYWEASLLQVASGGRLAIGACVPDQAGRLAPMHRASKDFTVADVTRGAFFVVVQRGPGYFSMANVLATFGPPAETRRTPDFEVLSYPGTG